MSELKELGDLAGAGMKFSKDEQISTLKLENRLLISNNLEEEARHRVDKSQLGRHFYFDQLRPLLVINWILARQPYSRNASGEFELEWGSGRMLWCVLVYCVEVVATALTGWQVLLQMHHMANVTNSTYDVTLYTSLLLIFLFAQLVIPILNWTIAKRFILFLNRWKNFQDLHLLVTGEEVKVGNYARFIRLYAVASAIIAIGIDAFESHFILSHLHWTYVLPFLFIAVDTLCLTATWAFSFLFIGNACNSIHGSLVQTRRSGGSGSSITAHRMLWLDLSRLHSDYSASQEYRMLTMMLLVLVCLVISSYGVVATVFSSSSITVTKLASFGVPLLYAICQLYAICEFAHQASIKIGDNFFRKLDWIESSKFTTQEWHEMETFVECLEIGRPGARVCGIFTINRKLFMQVIYEIASYLIILVQFQAAERNQSYAE